MKYNAAPNGGKPRSAAMTFVGAYSPLLPEQINAPPNSMQLLLLSRKRKRNDLNCSFTNTTLSSSSRRTKTGANIEKKRALRTNGNSEGYGKLVPSSAASALTLAAVVRSSAARTGPPSLRTRIIRRAGRHQLHEGGHREGTGAGPTRLMILTGVESTTSSSPASPLSSPLLLSSSPSMPPAHCLGSSRHVDAPHHSYCMDILGDRKGDTALSSLSCGPRASVCGETTAGADSPIFFLCADVMACCLTYLDPVEVHALITAPLSKSWRRCFAEPQDLWRVLCLSEPFRARFDEEEPKENDDGSDDNDDNDNDDRLAIRYYSVAKDPYLVKKFGPYRLLYESFVRCVRFLNRLQDDASQGARTPSATDEMVVAPGRHCEQVGRSGRHHTFHGNSSLRNFLSRIRAAQESEEPHRTGVGEANEGGSARAVEGDAADNQSTGHGDWERGQTPGIARSAAYELLHKPWSSAIYSVVNWMAAFPDVTGIQSMCLGVMPHLLQQAEDRVMARRAGLADVLLRSMLLFPDAADLHVSAFHALVLLARPAAGTERMLRANAGIGGAEAGAGAGARVGASLMALDAPPVLDAGTALGRSGAAILLDSMRHFIHDQSIQAYGCWSMVNLALVPRQKSKLVRSGGIAAALSAMAHHPNNTEVHFRALFALINLVIPTENGAESDQGGNTDSDEGLPRASPPSVVKESCILNEAAPYVATIVVASMRKFFSCEAILNRACLVLHNLSLQYRYHATLLLTPNLYQMLEWSVVNYRHDPVLQQGATGTIQRLQATLSRDQTLRTNFLQSLRDRPEGNSSN